MAQVLKPIAALLVTCAILGALGLFFAVPLGILL